jgi:hypothetical protein
MTLDQLHVFGEVRRHDKTDSYFACLEFCLTILWVLRESYQVLCVPENAFIILNSDLFPVLEHLIYRLCAETF